MLPNAPGRHRNLIVGKINNPDWSSLEWSIPGYQRTVKELEILKMSIRLIFVRDASKEGACRAFSTVLNDKRHFRPSKSNERLMSNVEP